MQSAPAITTTAFYLWWLAVNGFIFYWEYDFFLRFVDVPISRRSSWFFYVGLNSVVTFFVLFLPFSGLLWELLQLTILCTYLRLLLQLKWAEVAALAAVIFVLSTFLDGISVTIMRSLVLLIPNPVAGNLFYMGLTLLLVLLFVAGLRLIARRYRFLGTHVGAPYLYVLLLPSAFVVWIVRFGLGLDNPASEVLSAPFAQSAPLWAFACILGSMATFFVVLEILGKVIALSQKETEQTLFQAQLREQRTYLAEAEKREEQYRAFHHDIHNHLLILSGLSQEGKHQEVRQYFDKIHVAAKELLYPVSTGNPALDVLLREKFGFAERNGITVSHQIHLPFPSFVDDVDLCVVFSNALDNAIWACRKEETEEKNMNIMVGTRHRFLLIEVINPCHDTALIKPDTGMKNIKYIAEKYHGTMDFEKKCGSFRLSVLLCQNPNTSAPLAKRD